MKKTILLCIIIFSACLRGYSQWSQMCPRIFDSTAAGTDLQATSIAISDDKQFAVAGHSNGPNASGGFYVYANNGGQWQQQFAYKGTPGSRMGSKVAISGDGNTIVVGGGSGTFPVFDSLWIFNKNGLQWQMQFAGLMRASNLCLSYDGNTFLADCVVWNRDNNLWNIQDTLTFTDTVRASRVSDFAVLSRDGNTAVVNFGATWVYVRSGNQWVQQGPKLIVTLPFDSLYSPNQTYASSAISGDGNTIASLAQFNRRAAVVFYYRQGNLWTQDSTFLHDAGDYGGEMFLSHDGNSLLCNHRTNSNSDSVNFTVVRRNSSGWIDNITVGIEKTANAGQTHWATDSSGACILFSNSITNSNYGGVSTFNYNNGLWQRQPQKVYEPGRTGNSEQGKWVAMSGDGRTMAYVGIADSIPKVWIYYRTGSVWAKQGNGLTSPQGAAVIPQNFGIPSLAWGTSLALSDDGNTLAVGCPGYNLHAVFIYKRTGSTWNLEQQINGPAFYTFFGAAVALSADGNTLLVVSSTDGQQIYYRTGNAWALQSGIMSFSDGNGNIANSMSAALSADGNTAVIGDHRWNNKGAFHILKRIGSVWSSMGIFAPNNLSSSGNFPVGLTISANGYRIAASGGTGSSVGKLYTFVSSGNSWLSEGDICANGVCPTTSNNGYSIHLPATGDTLFYLDGNQYVTVDTKIEMYVKNGAQWALAYQFPVPFDWTGGAYSTSTPRSLSASNDLNYFVMGLSYQGGGDGGVFVYQGSNFDVETTIKPATCPYSSDGQLQINSASSIGITAIQWSTGDTGVHSLVNLSPGTYSVTVTGANAVTLVRTYTVGAVSNMLLNNVTTNLPCNSTGGSITINITGGVQPYAYQWNTTPPQNTNVATNLLQGSYTFSVTDSLGCLLTDTLQMAPNYYWTSTSITQPNCTNNGSATVNVYGGQPPYSYQWSNGSTSVVDTLLGAGTYTATVTDGNGCNMTATANLSYFCGNTISGRVFFDNNNNCQQDSAEVGASNYNVYATNGSYIAYGSTNSAGDYEIKVPTAGNFNVYISFRETCGYSGCPNSSYPANVVFATTNDTVTGINFAMFDSVYDLSLTALAHVINPGFSSQVRIYYSDLNNSFLPNATVTIAYDSTLIINHTIPAYTTLDSINRIITWNVNNVGAASPNQYVELNINPRLGMPAATSANLLCNITPDSADCDQVNNQLLLQLPIRGSFDPNSKSSSTNGSFKQTDSFIDYTIHFQNCGNDSTHFIIVTDTLSPYLDPASVQTLVTSFVPYTFELKQNGILSWRFDGYFLPDSATDPLNSQGLITFRVKLKSDLAFTEPVQNTAYIYFDYNPSVITNTVADTLAIPLTVFAVNTDKIKIYPNPTNQLLYIEVTDNNEHTIILFDSKGSRLHTKQFSGEVTKLDLSDISSGVYYIEVHNTEQKVWRTKMIKID